MKKLILCVIVISITTLFVTYSSKAQETGWTIVNSYPNLDLFGMALAGGEFGYDSNIEALIGGGESGYSGTVYDCTNQNGVWNCVPRSIPVPEEVQTVSGLELHGLSKTDNTLDTLHNDTLWVGCEGGYIFYTNNSGINWTQQPTGTSYTIKGLSFINSQTGWAVGGSTSACVILHTTNAGSTWSPQNTTYSHGLLSVSFVDANHGWACGTYDSILYTSNGGANWVGRSPALPVTSSWYNIHFINPDTGWTVGNNGQGQALTLRTTNGGVVWNIGNVDQDPNTLYCLSFANANTGYAAGGNFSGAGCILKTTDGGSNWVSQTLPANTPILYTVSCFNADSVVAAGHQGTILYTSSGGQPIGIKQISGNVPKGFVLEQNYPNPFNPSSKIKFQISKSSNVKLTVYDAIGREVSTLVNQQLQPGSYEVNWDASNEPSGVYFYRLSAGNFTQTKKMALIK